MNRHRSAAEIRQIDPVSPDPALHLKASLSDRARNGRNVPRVLAQQCDDLFSPTLVIFRQRTIVEGLSHVIGAAVANIFFSRRLQRS